MLHVKSTVYSENLSHSKLLWNLQWMGAFIVMTHFSGTTADSALI